MSKPAAVSFCSLFSDVEEFKSRMDKEDFFSSLNHPLLNSNISLWNRNPRVVGSLEGGLSLTSKAVSALNAEQKRQEKFWYEVRVESRVVAAKEEALTAVIGDVEYKNISHSRTAGNMWGYNSFEWKGLTVYEYIYSPYAFNERTRSTYTIYAGSKFTIDGEVMRRFAPSLEPDPYNDNIFWYTWPDMNLEGLTSLLFQLESVEERKGFYAPGEHIIHYLFRFREEIV